MPTTPFQGVPPKVNNLFFHAPLGYESLVGLLSSQLQSEHCRNCVPLAEVRWLNGVGI